MAKKLKQQRKNSMHFGPPLQVVIIVQARMGASRLPGKPLKKVLGRPLLSYLLERLKRCKQADCFVVATTEKKQDDLIVKLALKEGVDCVRGSEEDVLSRYLLAARTFDADLIVRITADNPLIDPLLIDSMLEEFKKQTQLDYFSNTLKRSFPRGMDVEIFTREALEKAAAEALDPAEREHVTLYIYRHPEKFKLMNREHPVNLSHYRWTVDTEEDYALIRKILLVQYREKKNFTLEDLVALMRKHPEWTLINEHIEQKRVP